MSVAALAVDDFSSPTASQRVFPSGNLDGSPLLKNKRGTLPLSYPRPMWTGHCVRSRIRTCVSPSASREIRTHTVYGLNVVSLPIGVERRNYGRDPRRVSLTRDRFYRTLDQKKLRAGTSLNEGYDPSTLCSATLSRASNPVCQMDLLGLEPRTSSVQTKRSSQLELQTRDLSDS